MSKKRQRRYDNRKIPAASPRNKFVALAQIIVNCRNALTYASRNGWSDLDWPEGWSLEKYCFLKDYCCKKLTNHKKGRAARIMGGPEITQAFNELIFSMIDDDI